MGSQLELLGVCQPSISFDHKPFHMSIWVLVIDAISQSKWFDKLKLFMLWGCPIDMFDDTAGSWQPW